MDQRRFPRVHHQCVVSLRQAHARPSIAASTENIGIGGVCVLIDQGLDIFAPVDVELNLEDGQPPIACRGMVAWVVRRRELNRPGVRDCLRVGGWPMPGICGGIICLVYRIRFNRRC